MIANFFNKATPIYFVIVTIILFFAFTFSKFLNLEEPVNMFFIGKQLLLFAVCVFSLFVFDFFTNRNNLTKKNSYKFLFYVLFMVLIPQTFLNSKLLIANLFILFAIRRIISLRSKKELKKKLLDAAFWISLATLLCFWSSLFFLLIFAALFLLKESDIKNWIIPFLGVFIVAIIGYCFLIIFKINPIDYFSESYLGTSLDFSSLNSRSIIIAATVIFSYFLWASFYYFKIIKRKSKRYKSSYILIFLTAIIAISIIIIIPQKTGAEFIFLIAPLSIITTNYVETISEKWFKEIYIWLLIIIIPVMLLL